ncbi:threonine dehydrogenase-like Zn-dependent dehydrogenase [Deinococcus metalli]|uniref:Glutathione-dependent formaldehyde dehydrogenase n=1 Tax=Deinococcus metalli TaxID=1141878 RepID=A0A7W8KL35_9DEIO|nr:zinc-dependent alcohol dehydrogenase [Deinococcus metalli]MBB5379253.1 threonine dehydrogenase-like Zn-dependent dehydrogenase [Deinococcus metalli]GHF65741.1 glutathione-dependent formaldehyde dehydrogenase [Deinococcus metalli]
MSTAKTTMKAVVWHGIGDIRVDDVPQPTLQEPTDAIVRVTASAICGTDLHFIRGTMSGMVPGTILGHEGVGVVEAVGTDVRNFAPGDRVVIPSTVSCGSCPQCRQGNTAQCDNANPNGPAAGTAFYGGPKESGPLQGLQAEKARILHANSSLIKLPDNVSDEQAILLSDIFPTAYFGAELAGVTTGSVVVVLGCGPVGQFAIISAKLRGATRIIAVDRLDDRLAKARENGAETVNFEHEDPVQAVLRLTGDVGADCVIDAVGVDAQHAHGGPARPDRATEKKDRETVQQVAPDAKPTRGGQWVPGDAPTQALEWAVEMVRKAGQIGIIGVYSPSVEKYPLGKAMNKNLTVRMGNCNHRTHIPKLLEYVAAGVVDPTTIITEHEHIEDAISAYEAFDKRQPGWIKVELHPQA